MLLPCFLEAARRLDAADFDLLEIGPSAGLNLVWDRYGYRYANGTWGDAAATITLSGEERRPVPAELLELSPRVRSRVGIDLAPIDATSAEGALLLRSFVWPDMTDRLARLDRAIELLRSEPPRIVEGDVVERLPELLDGDAPLLVFETIALIVRPERRAATRRRGARRGGRAPPARGRQDAAAPAGSLGARAPGVAGRPARGRRARRLPRRLARLARVDRPSDHEHAAVVRRARDAVCPQQAARVVERRERSGSEARCQHAAARLLHVVRAHRDDRAPQHPSVGAVDAQRAAPAAGHKGEAAVEGDVLRRPVTRESREQGARAVVVDRERELVSGADPDVTPVGREADVVREKRRPEAPDDPRAPWTRDVEDDDLACLRAERDPERPCVRVRARGGGRARRPRPGRRRGRARRRASRPDRASRR